MRDPRLPERGPVSSTSAHLTEWTLEQLAEGMLSRQDEAQARAHLEACARCGAELEAFRAMFAALGALPRFAPSPAFADAVMERVRVAPQGSPALARLNRWLPKTRRGWMLLTAALVAPAVPMIAFALWVLIDPLMSAASLWQWLSLEVQEGARITAGSLVSFGSSLGVVERTDQLLAALSAVPLGTLSTVVGILGVAIPLSAWTLVRLTRTPTQEVTYAN
jgi:hypothetical protein